MIKMVTTDDSGQPENATLWVDREKIRRIWLRDAEKSIFNIVFTDGSDLKVILDIHSLRKLEITV